MEILLNENFTSPKYSEIDIFSAPFFFSGVHSKFGQYGDMIWWWWYDDDVNWACFISVCAFRALREKKAITQRSQTCFFSLGCAALICWARWPFSLNLFWQSLHSWSFVGWKIWMCLSVLPLCWSWCVGQSLDYGCKLARLGQGHCTVSSNHPILENKHSRGKGTMVSYFGNKMEVKGSASPARPDWRTKGGPVSTRQHKVCHWIPRQVWNFKSCDSTWPSFHY